MSDFWTPHDWISASVEYNYSNFETDTDLKPFSALMTHRFPLGANFFHSNGIFFRLRASYVDQSGDYYDRDENDETIRLEASDPFWVIDAALGYRLPKR